MVGQSHWRISNMSYNMLDINMKNIHGRHVYYVIRPLVLYYYCHNYISQVDPKEKQVMMRKHYELVKRFNKELCDLKIVF